MSTESMRDLVGGLQCRISRCRIDDVNPNWSGERAPRAFMAVYLPLAGNASIQTSGVDVHLDPDNLYLILCHRPLRAICPKYMRLLWTHCEVHHSGRPLWTCFKLRSQVALAAQPELRDLFLELHRLKTQEPLTAADMLRCDAYLRLLIAPFIQEPLQADAIPVALQEVANHIENHPETNLSLDELAKLTPWNRDHFTRVFRQHFGVTPVEYVRRRRVDLMGHRLLETADSLETIAAELGFYDQFHASRLFKQLTGLSPRDYRQQGARIP